MESYIDDKFYVPTIEEFCVGFEFDGAFATDGVWESYTWNIKGNIPYQSVGFNIDFDLEETIKEGDIRVKYLDKSDIEELGFSITSRDNEEVIRFTINEEKNIVGFYHPDVYKLGIYSVVELGKNEHFFGEIKNKNELKVLLRQLNIIKINEI